MISALNTGEVSYFLPKQAPYKTPVSWNKKGKWREGQKEPRAGDIPDLNTETLNAINFHSHSPVCDTMSSIDMAKVTQCI